MCLDRHVAKQESTMESIKGLQIVGDDGMQAIPHMNML
jgi:hypothetical protein